MLTASLTLLGLNLCLVFLCVLLLWLACLPGRDPTPMDAFWAFGLLVVCVSSFVQTGAPTTRKWLLLGICAAWAFRLGCYLLWRWRGHGPDPRYATMMRKAAERRGWNYPYASLRLVFLTQAPLLWLTSLPVQLGQIDPVPAPIGPLAAAGAAIALIGIAFETVGDWQLARFRRDPDNRGRVMDRGLWRYTRHPNYFGDACVWWGLYLIAAETAAGRWAIAGPLFLTYTLLKWSGAALLERRLSRSRPGYEDYVARTSAFIPWFPRKGGGRGPGV